MVGQFPWERFTSVTSFLGMACMLQRNSFESTHAREDPAQVNKTPLSEALGLSVTPGQHDDK